MSRFKKDQLVRIVSHDDPHLFGVVGQYVGVVAELGEAVGMIPDQPDDVLLSINPGTKDEYPLIVHADQIADAEPEVVK